MNPATGAVLTAVIVTGGELAGGKLPSVRVVVGGTMLTVGLSVLGEASPDLAGKFATLIVAVAAFTYLPTIAWKVGLLDNTKYKTPPKWI